MFKKKHLLVVDNMALLFRGFYATSMSGRIMQTSNGVYINGIYQYLRYLFDAIKRFKPDYLIVATDVGKKTFRNEIYPEYKKNRGEPPVELVPQFSLIKEVIESFGLPIIGVEGYEADDLLGSISRQFKAEDLLISLLTGDGDALQLVDESTNVIMMQKGMGNYKVYTEDVLKTEKQLSHPLQIIDLKALMGDSSDNIPGCPQVGPKTALKFIQEHQSLEQIYENIDSIKGKHRERLIEYKEQVFLSKRLAAIKTDITIDITIEQCEIIWPHEQIKMKLKELEMERLLSELPTHPNHN